MWARAARFAVCSKASFQRVFFGPCSCGFLPARSLGILWTSSKPTLRVASSSRSRMNGWPDSIPPILPTSWKIWPRTSAKPCLRPSKKALPPVPLEELEPKVQKAVLESLDSDRAADIVEEMEPDAAADLLADLSDDKTEEILVQMQPEERQEVTELLEFKENQPLAA